MESADHQALKTLCVAFARRLGCCAVATEVASPIPRHRVDVAGYADGPAPQRRGERRLPFTVIIEVKQARPDFLRDSRNRATLLRQRAELERQRELFERSALGGSGLAKGDAASAIGGAPRGAPEFLFSEMARWDDAIAATPTHRRIVREIRSLDRRLYGETKFCALAAWRQADMLFIAAPRGMFRTYEIPAGWGLVEFVRPSRAGSSSGGGGEAPFEIRIPSAPLGCPDERRRRLLRNIAVAAASGRGGAGVARQAVRDSKRPAVVL